MNELFLKIINISISASWLILAVLILRFVLKKAPKWVDVLLWGIVAVRLICPFSIESPISLIPDSIGTGEFLSEWMNDYIDDIDIHHPDSVHYDAAIGAGREPISDGENGYYVVTKHDQLGEPATIENTVMPVLSVVWASGMILLALYTTISYWRLRRKVDTAVLYKDNIFQSENVNSPFVLGIIKPKIYLPFKLDGQNLEHVVAHEQAHIRRKDQWWKPLGFLLLTIHWFNPLMWLAYVLLCRDIELACDEKVIRVLNNEQRADYTQALVACSANPRMLSTCPLAFGEIGVKERVKSIMNYKKPTVWIVALAVIACIIVALCFLTVPSYPSRNPIVLPATNKIDSIDITTLDGSRVSYSDKEWIEQFLAVVTQAQATTRDSIQDAPNAEVYGKVDIANNGEVTTFFYYIDDEKYCIEQPYQGIYETDVDIDTLVKGVDTDSWFLVPQNLELSTENGIEVELTELKTILPMIEDLGSYNDIEFRHYPKNMFIFSSDAYILRVTYDAENYQNEKENFSKKYVYEKDKLSDYGGYNKDPDFEMDTYSFQMLSYDNYKLQAYPHEMVFVGVSDERQEIAVVYYSDSDLDIIDSSFPEFLISECEWK